MKTEIISIGSEITSGQSLDTNSRWLSRRLSEIGIPVQFHSSVSDELDANLDVFQNAVRRAQLVIATGGLGPTADDLTRSVLSLLAGVELVFDEPSFQAIEAMFRKRGRQMPESNRIQAYLPAGATPIPNHHGTAPGIWMELAGSLVVCMPGVPAEMFPMFDESVLPRLRAQFGGANTIVERTIHTYGAGEATVAEMLGDLINRDREPRVGITASEATISLRIVSSASTPEAAAMAADRDAEFIRQRLGHLVFGEDDDQLQHIVAKQLIEKGLTISTAESCTGGLLGHLLTEVPGISQAYLGGIVSYSNEAKTDLLSVPGELIHRHGAVSPEVASAMATGCRHRFGSTLAVAITGIAGPDGGTPEKPVGLVYVALAHGNGVETGKYNWPSERSSIKLRSAKLALNLVRLHLLQR